MATATEASFVGRTKATVSDDAKFGKIKTVTALDFYATSWFQGSSGFIVGSAGDTFITPTEGDSVAASAFTAKTLYEIGVRRVSGSGTVHIVY
mgnify:FL=1